VRAWPVLAALLLASAAIAHPCKLKPIVFRPDGPPKPWSLAPAAAKLEGEGGYRKSNATPPGQKTRHGVAEILVPAEPAQVLDSLQRYGDYQAMAPKKFKTSRLVAISKTGQSDVYMQIAILRGALTLWLTMRFDAPRVERSGARVVEGRYVDGNLSGAHVRYVVEGAGEHKTYVRLELLIELPVPAPQDAIDEELRDAAGDALRGVAARFR
jgi:hypothetical protein